MIRFRPKKILSALDGSLSGFNAFLHAKRLAERFDGRIEAIHVEAAPRPRAEAERRGEDAFADMRGRIGTDVPLIVRRGEPAEEITARAWSGGCDLVVLGTHGRTGAARLLFGSVAETVLCESPVPVWIAKHRPRRLRTVLAPVHFEPDAQPGLETAAAVAAGLGASLKILHVCRSKEDRRQAKEHLTGMTERLPGRLMQGKPPRITIRVGDPAVEIARAASPNGLTVLVAHNRAKFTELLWGTTAERVLRTAPSCLLAIPYSKTSKASSSDPVFAPA